MKFFKGKHAPKEDKAAYRVGQRFEKNRKKEEAKAKKKEEEDE